MMFVIAYAPLLAWRIAAVPASTAVIVPAVKLPVASRFTMELAVLAAVASVQTGAAAPAAVRTSPASPAASMAVVLAADWYGTWPISPPLRLVAVVAVAALPVMLIAYYPALTAEG